MAKNHNVEKNSEVPRLWTVIQDYLRDSGRASHVEAELNGVGGATLSVRGVGNLSGVIKELCDLFDFQEHFGSLVEWLSNCTELRSVIRVSQVSDPQSDHVLRVRLVGPEGLDPPQTQQTVCSYKIAYNAMVPLRDRCDMHDQYDIPFSSYEEIDAYTAFVLRKIEELLSGLAHSKSTSDRFSDFPKHIGPILRSYFSSDESLPDRLDPPLRLTLVTGLLAAHKKAAAAVLANFNVEAKGVYEIYAASPKKPEKKENRCYGYSNQQDDTPSVDKMVSLVSAIFEYYEAQNKAHNVDITCGGIHSCVSDMRTVLTELFKEHVKEPYIRRPSQEHLERAFTVDISNGLNTRSLAKDLYIIREASGFLEKISPTFHWKMKRNFKKFTGCLGEFRQRFNDQRLILDALLDLERSYLDVVHEGSVYFYGINSQYQGLCAFSSDSLRELRQLVEDGENYVKSKEVEKIRFLSSYFDWSAGIQTETTFYRDLRLQELDNLLPPPDRRRPPGCLELPRSGRRGCF
jgi:hypothetical protein